MAVGAVGPLIGHVLRTPNVPGGSNLLLDQTSVGAKRRSRRKGRVGPSLLVEKPNSLLKCGRRGRAGVKESSGAPERMGPHPSGGVKPWVKWVRSPPLGLAGYSVVYGGSSSESVRFRRLPVPNYGAYRKRDRHMQSFTILVDSSAIHYVSYTESGRTLEVGFNPGGIYTYLGVPLQVAVDLVTADSVGMYYNRAIKNQFGDSTYASAKTPIAASAMSPALPRRARKRPW